MRYALRHATEYVYGAPVDLATHLLHLTPRSLPGQRVLRAEVSVEPAPTRRTEGEDHFGNAATWLFLDAPHDRFGVVLSAEVDVEFPAPPPDEATPAWEAVVEAVRGRTGWREAEFAIGSPMAPADPTAGAYAARSFAAGRPVLSALRDLMARIRADIAFRPGATSISTPVGQVLAQRAGVCQDLAHLMIAGLRSLGLPARYVSGYVRTRPPPGQPKRQGADQSHAWVGCWLGPALGWVDLDPTNDLVVRDEHVVLGWGRDYGDVSPVKGILLGGGRQSMAVAVDLEAIG